jgi:hypothetical protein
LHSAEPTIHGIIWFYLVSIWDCDNMNIY